MAWWLGGPGGPRPRKNSRKIAAKYIRKIARTTEFMRHNKNATLDRNVSFQIMFIYLFNNVRPNIIIIYIYKNQGQNKKVTQYNSAVRSVLNYCPHKICS